MHQVFNRSIVGLMGIVLVASGCSTTTRVWVGDTTAASVLPQVEPGDRILLIRPGGDDLDCSFKGADAEFVYGCRDPVARDDISEVRFRRIAGRRALTLPDLRVGDKATVTMRSGEVRVFTIAAVDASVLRGEDVDVAISQVRDIDVTRISGARTLGVVVAVVVVAGGIVAMLMLNQISDLGKGWVTSAGAARGIPFTH